MKNLDTAFPCGR